MTARSLFTRVPRLPTLRALGVALTLLLAAVLVVPEPAAALSLNPADWAVDGFRAILGWIFGDVDKIASHLINFLLAVP